MRMWGHVHTNTWTCTLCSCANAYAHAFFFRIDALITRRNTVLVPHRNWVHSSRSNTQRNYKTWHMQRDKIIHITPTPLITLRKRTWQLFSKPLCFAHRHELTRPYKRPWATVSAVWSTNSLIPQRFIPDWETDYPPLFFRRCRKAFCLRNVAESQVQPRV